MRSFIAWFLAAVVLAGVGVAGGRLARADSTVLEYDRSGRVKGLRHTTVKGDVHITGQGRRAAPGGVKTRSLGQSSGRSLGRSPGGKGAVFTRGRADGTPRPENWFVKRELVVADPPEGFGVAVQTLGFAVTERIVANALGLTLWRLRTPDGMTAPDGLKLLRESFAGIRIDLNHLYRASRGRNFPTSQPRALIGWGKATPGCGAGIRIGMIDTAVDVSHPALAGRKVFYRSFLQPTRRPAAANHGTAIAAMLVGRADANGWGGMLPAAELYAANIFGISDDGRVMADVLALVRAVDWEAKEKVNAINLSIAGADNRILRFGLDRAQEKGLVMVAAAGNWGTAAQPAYPAAYGQVLAITAVDMNGTIYAMANRGSYIDFAAPGVQIWTAVPGGGRFQSGTSFAVPYVTSLVASRTAAGMAAVPDLLRNLLRHAASDLGAVGKDDVFGWGIVKRLHPCD